MILSLKRILLALCLVPGIYLQNVVLSDVRLRGEADSLLFSQEAFKKFHQCFCDDQPETCAGSLNLKHLTPHTIPMRGRENTEELRKAYKMYAKCYSEGNSHLSKSSVQTVCYQNSAACEGINLCTRYDCVKRQNAIHVERDDSSIRNTCQIECPQRGSSIYPKYNQNFNRFQTDGIKSEHKSGDANPRRRTLPFTREEDTNHQRLANNVVLLVAVGLALALSAVGCLGAGCHLIKKRQRSANNIVRSYASNGNSEYVQFPTSGGTSRLGAQQMTSVTRYCFDPTSAPQAPLPTTAGSIQTGDRAEHSTSGLTRLNNVMDEEESDFVNTKTLIDNGLVIPTGVRAGKSNYQPGATAKKPGEYSLVEINLSDHSSQKTGVKFNRDLHRIVDQPNSTQEYLQSDNNVGIQSNVSTPHVISIDPFKREHEKIASDPSAMKTYAKLNVRMTRRLNDYNTFIKGEDEKLKYRDLSEYPSTTGGTTREHESNSGQEDQLAGSDYTNSWIADEVSGEGGFKVFAAEENASYCSSSDSDVYINTNCEDLQHARLKGRLFSDQATNRPDLHLRHTALADSRTELGDITTVSCYTDLSSDEALGVFLDLEDGDHKSHSSDENGVYFNTASDEVISLQQREPSTRTNKRGETGHGIKVTETNKPSDKNHSVDNVDNVDNTDHVERTTIHAIDDIDDDFYFNMSQIVNAKGVHDDHNTGFAHDVHFHYSDAVYNNTNMEACSKTLSGENEAENEMRSKSHKYGEFQSCYQASDQSVAGKDEGVCMPRSVAAKDEAVCMTNKLNNFNDQALNVRIEDEHFINTCSQNDYPNDDIWTVGHKALISSAPALKRDCVEKVHRYDVEDDDVISYLHDDIYYYDVSKFQHGSLLPESCQEGNGVDGDNDFLLRVHEEIGMGYCCSEDGSNNYDSGSRDFGGTGAREDDDENVDSDGDEYINVGYDNYKDSVHDERHLCRHGAAAPGRDGHEICKAVILDFQPSDSGQLMMNTDMPGQLLADSGKRSMRAESRKHSYFQLERDY